VAEELLEPEVLSFRDCERQLLDGFLDFRLEHLLSLGHDGSDVLRAAALKKRQLIFLIKANALVKRKN